MMRGAVLKGMLAVLLPSFAMAEALPDWAPLSPEARQYAEADERAAAGNERFVSLDVDATYPNYKVVQRVERLGRYAQVSRLDGYGEAQIEGPATHTRIMQAWRGFFSMDDQYELASVAYREEPAFPRAAFELTTDTRVPSAPGGLLHLARRCNFVEATPASGLIEGLPGEIFQYRCDSYAEGTATALPVLRFYYSDYLNMVVNRFYERDQNDDINVVDLQRTLTFLDETGAQRVVRYSSFGSALPAQNRK